MSKISAQMANTIASAAQIPLVAVNALYAHFPILKFHIKNRAFFLWICFSG